MTVYECAFHFVGGVNNFYNVLHFDITGDTPLNLQDLTDEIVASWVANMSSTVSPAISFVDITYRLDSPGSVGSTITPTGGSEVGTAASSDWAGQLGMLVQKKTNGLVRPTLGRVFAIGITAGALTVNGTWAAANMSAVETFWDDIIIVPFADNGQAEMLIKASNPTAPNTNAYNSVVECTAKANPVTLHSRKLGVGT